MKEESPLKPMLESIWAPWRVEYFERKEAEGGAFLEEAARCAPERDRELLVVERRKASYLIMNRYPYSGGHLMAVPYRKTDSLEDLTEGERLELWDLVIYAQKLLRHVVKAQGFNIGINLGASAGAGVVDHLHVHIVPRWQGDVNFMTVVGQARVIPEGLMPLYDKLMAAREEVR